MNVLATSLALLGLAVANAAAAASGEARVAYLAEELDAARTRQFYLVLDEAAPALELKIEGVRVHRFVLDRADFGQSRLAGTGERRWPAVSYRLVSEVPEPDRPRIKVEKADESTKSRDAAIKQAIARGEKPAGELAQTAGEKVALESRTEDGTAPMTFRLQFEPDLVVVVRGEPRSMDIGSRLRRLRYALQDGWQGFVLWLRDETIATRVVMYLPPEDARHLFKLLTPDIRLLVQAPPAG